MGDLITLRLEGAVNLRELFRRDALEARIWIEIGRVIGALHRHSVRHGDLNATNILVKQEGAVPLVDFDKSIFEKDPSIWKARNLSPLHASLTKLSGRYNPFYFEEADWERVFDGYKSA